MIICVDWTSTDVTHHQVVAIITQHPKVPASMVGSIAIHMVQEQGYSIVHYSPLLKAAIVTAFLEDGVGYDSFLKITYRILWISTLQDILHAVFSFLDIVRFSYPYALLVLMHFKQAGTCSIILVHLGIFLVGGVGYPQEPSSLHIAFTISHTINDI